MPRPVPTALVNMQRPAYTQSSLRNSVKLSVEAAPAFSAATPSGKNKFKGGALPSVSTSSSTRGAGDSTGRRKGSLGVMRLKSEKEERRLARALRGNLLFAHLQPEAHGLSVAQGASPTAAALAARRREVFALLEPVRVRAGDVIVRQRARADYIYVVDEVRHLFSCPSSLLLRAHLFLLALPRCANTSHCFRVRAGHI